MGGSPSETTPGFKRPPHKAVLVLTFARLGSLVSRFYVLVFRNADYIQGGSHLIMCLARLYPDLRCIRSPITLHSAHTKKSAQPLGWRTPKLHCLISYRSGPRLSIESIYRKNPQWHNRFVAYGLPSWQDSTDTAD